jgi:glycosyltransferase involved in cell wall biosynthesis
MARPGASSNNVTLSIVLATTGRPTLGAAIESATSQMLPGDELLVVFDASGDAGDSPRNRVLENLHGTHIAFLDDDDEYRPGALDIMRRFAREHPDRVGIFRIDLGMWGVAWARPDLMASATAMYLLPNIPSKLGRFGRAPGLPAGRVGDFRFIIETIASLGEPIWCEEIVQDIRPVKGFTRIRHRLALRRRLSRLAGSPVPPLRGAAPDYPEAREWARRILDQSPDRRRESPN